MYYVKAKRPNRFKDDGTETKDILSKKPELSEWSKSRGWEKISHRKAKDHEYGYVKL